MKFIVSLVVLVFVAACSESPSPDAGGETARTIRVAVASARQRDIDDVLTALGSVESINDPTVSAETAGQVKQIAVSEGDSVVAGQLLAALDGTLHAIESAKAAAELRRYGVLVENQANEVKRLQRLDKSRSVSRDKLEDEQAQLEILAAQREMADKQWQQYRYLESKTQIVAPLDGLVTRRYISPGDYVSAGQPLFDLVSVDRLRARIAFPEQAASRIAVGKEVRLTSPAAPGVMATGEVAAVNPQIKVHNRAVEVTVTFDNPGGWLPGASVDATLVVERREQALTIPAPAIQARDGRDVVFLVTGEQVQAVPIVTGWREADWVEIVSGIAATDLVVVEGAGLVSDGSRVDVDATAQ